jgi:hypothetical protein
MNINSNNVAPVELDRRHKLINLFIDATLIIYDPVYAADEYRVRVMRMSIEHALSKECSKHAGLNGDMMAYANDVLENSATLNRFTVQQKERVMNDIRGSIEKHCTP